MKKNMFQSLNVKKGHVLIQQGENCEHFIKVMSGQVKVFIRSPQGKEMLLYRIEPSETCVLTTSSLLGDNEFPAEAVAEVDTELHIMSRKEFLEAFGLDPDFRKKVFDDFSLQLKNLVLRVEEVTGESINQRLVKYLLQKNNLEISITHNDIAKEIGSIREVVSRALKKLENKGMILLKRGSINILNKEQLKLLIDRGDF